MKEQQKKHLVIAILLSMGIVLTIFDFMIGYTILGMALTISYIWTFTT